jgi:membrane-associated phospholipid phosphatase
MVQQGASRQDAERVNRGMLAVSIACAGAAIALSLYVASHPFIPEDAVIERDVQATQWGPLALTFPFFTWIGDAKGFVIEVVIFLAILVVNRRAWIFAAGAALSGAWYELGIHLIDRPRPTTAQVLQVTEHPGASSYPSGHTVFIVTVTVVLMLGLGYRFLPRWARVIGWVLIVLIIGANAIARIYTGAHWPTDVLGAILIATAWLAFLLSLRWVSARMLPTER